MVTSTLEITSGGLSASSGGVWSSSSLSPTYSRLSASQAPSSVKDKVNSDVSKVFCWPSSRDMFTSDGVTSEDTGGIRAHSASTRKYHRKVHTQTRAPMGITHIRVCAVSPPVQVHGGTTSSVVPLRTQMGVWHGCRRHWCGHGRCPLGPVFACAFSCVCYTLGTCREYTFGTDHKSSQSRLMQPVWPAYGFNHNTFQHNEYYYTCIDVQKYAKKNLARNKINKWWLDTPCAYMLLLYS